MAGSTQSVLCDRAPATARKAPLVDADGEAHARHVVKRYSTALREHRALEADMHLEARAGRWHSYEGLYRPARERPLITIATQSRSRAIDRWIAGPFHPSRCLPQPSQRRIGSCSKGNVHAAAINVESNAMPPILQFRSSLMKGGPLTGQAKLAAAVGANYYQRPVFFVEERMTYRSTLSVK